MKHLFTTCLSTCLIVSSAQTATVAYYEFDGTGTAVVGSTITDTAGNHPGTVVGGDLVYGSDSLVGGYMSFKADGLDRVAIPGAPGFVFGIDQAYTMEVIFRTTMTTAVGSLIAKGTDVSNPDSQWWLRYQGGGQVRGLVEGFDNTSEDSATSSAATPVNDGQWHRVALVYDGTLSPARLDIYIDGNRSGSDTAIATLGVIGGDDNDPVLIGEFASLNATRSFAGDIAAVRFSDAALSPGEFLQLGKTYFTDITPTNGASFLPATTVASFVVNSPFIGVSQGEIKVLLNGNDVSAQLSFSGTDLQRTVTLPALSANQRYTMEAIATDKAANHISQTVNFNTFAENLLFVEAEDYNFESGKFIDNPPLSSVAGPNSYLDRVGTEGVDYHQTNTPTVALYRIADQVGTAIGTDKPRQAYLDAQVTDPGVADYMANEFYNTEWLNYTRTFPAGTYQVYARVAKGGTVPLVLRLDEVTSGSTSPNQTTAPLGTFSRVPTGSTSAFDFVPLVDALGREIAMPLSGARTLRLTMVSGTAAMNVNYLLFVPISEVQRPFVSSVSPAAGAGSVVFNAPIQATIRNANTTVTTTSVQLKLDGTPVTPSVTSTALGAQVSYTPSLMTTGAHTATLTFTDSASVTITNQWGFYVANQAVRGYWTFNEKPAGSFASTNAGAILDLSGNSRNGTVTTETMGYVTGSLNYGNTRALAFTSGTDRVVVSDASGDFNFTGGFTFEAVVRTTGSTTTAAILAKNGTGDGEGEYWWRLPGASGGVQRVGLNGNFVSGTNRLNDGAWHHLAVVYDPAASEVRLYADYILDGSLTGVVFDRPVGRPADLHLGSFIGGGSEFEGDIDLVRISDGALSSDQFVQRSVPLSPVVQALLPVQGSKGVAPQPRISATLRNRDLSVQLNTLRLIVDTQDVTANATKSEEATTASISYAPGSALANGAHTATIIFSDNGSPTTSYTNSWTFTVISSLTVQALYLFDEKAPGSVPDTTSGAILDGSGLGRNGTVSNTLAYVAGSPAYGDTSAMQFVPGGSPVIVPDSTGTFNFTPTQSITMEAVIRTVNIGENSVGAIAAKQGASPGEWWWRINATGTQQFWMNDGSGSRNVAGSAPLNDGLWHHVAAIYDAGLQELRLYVDYQLDGSPVTAVYTNGASVIGNGKDLWLGAFQNMDREFEGEMDVVRMTGEALDPSWFIPLGGIIPAPPSVTLTAVRIFGAEIQFSFATQAGRSYAVQATETLNGTWTDLETLSGDGNSRTAKYPATGLRRFFRVQAR